MVEKITVLNFFYTFVKKFRIMNKKESHQVVLDAKDKVVSEIGKEVFGMLGAAQQAQLIQNKLPTKPLYCLAKVREILNNETKQGGDNSGK